MDMNAYAEWCYHQQIAAYNTWCFQAYQHQQQLAEQNAIQTVSRYIAMSLAEKAEGERIKAQFSKDIEAHRLRLEEATEFNAEFEAILKEADDARLAYAKEIYSNEKAQEKAQCRVYREEDKFERLLDWQRERTQKRRMSRKQRATDKVKSRADAAEEQRQIKNYPQEVFEKTQLDISLGKGRIHGERGRHSIPRTKREMGTSFGWKKNTSRNW